MSFRSSALDRPPIDIFDIFGSGVFMGGGGARGAIAPGVRFRGASIFLFEKVLIIIIVFHNTLFVLTATTTRPNTRNFVNKNWLFINFKLHFGGNKLYGPRASNL